MNIMGQVQQGNPKILTTDTSSLFSGAGFMTSDAAIGGGLAFLKAELEKIDTKLREPLTSVTWPRDIVVKTGGGWVEFTSNQFVNYATSGPNAKGIIGGQTNAIPVIQADIQKEASKVFTWAHILKVPFIDQQKLQQIGRSLEDILDKGLRLNYQKTIEMNVYTGFSDYGTTGLLNNPNVYAAAVANGAGGTKPWAGKTPDEILTDINAALIRGWAASEYDLQGMPNHILIPPTQFALLVSRKVSDAGNISVLNYLLENNIAKSQGVDLVIAPSRYCIGAGAGATDRMFAYVNDEDKLNFDITVEIQRVMTQPVVTEMSYLTAYAAQIGQVKFLYFQPPTYSDGI